jgi:hypothetical protein
MRQLMVITLCLSLAGCGLIGDIVGSDSDPELVGAWQGSADGVTFNFTFEQNGTSVTGTGNVSGAGGTLAVTASGTHSHPNVNFTIAADGFNAATFAGAFTDDRTIDGLLNGSGFVSSQLILRKQ